MLQIQRLKRPSFEQVQDATKVCEQQWAYLGPMNCRMRFETLQKLGVELVLAQDGEDIQGVCFVLPDAYTDKDQSQDFVWLFQLYVIPESRNLGALMLMRMMSWYPAIMCTGVTEEAGEIYSALRWEHYDDIWRCIHPVDLNRMAEAFEGRITSGWQRATLFLFGVIYTPVLRFFEVLVGRDVTVEILGGEVDRHEEDRSVDSIEAKLGCVANYLEVIRIRRGHHVLTAVVLGGMGRIVEDRSTGWNRVKVLCRLWLELRKKGAMLSESIASSEKQRRAAIWFGSFPLRMPIYYWDKENRLGSFFSQIEGMNFTYSDCDKIY